MKKNLLSIIVLISMVLGMVSSAAATPISGSISAQTTDLPEVEHVIARVYYSTQDELNTLASRYDILQINQDQDIAYILVSMQEFSSLQQAGYRLEVDQAKTKLLNQPATALPGQGPDTIPGFPCYRTVEETQTSMQAIVTAHPDLAQLYDIGDSWTRIHSGFPNGYDIMALRLTNEDPDFGDIADKPTFFLMAEIHAREYVTTEAAMRYAEYLVDNYGIDPDITWLLDYYKVYIVTLTNPDGRKKAEAGQSWRKNVDSDDGCTDPYSWGVDLNRNHTFSWNRGGSSPYACDETYMGPSAGSEPETQAIETYINTLFADQRGPGENDPAPANTTGLFITLHSAAGLVLWPWGFKSSPAPNGTQLQTLGRHLAYFNQYNPQQSYQLYPTSGTSDEHAYGVLGIAAYTYEMGTEFFQDCGSFESIVYPDNRDSLLYAFKAARQPYMDPAGPESLTVIASPAAVSPGEQVLLTASATDIRFAGGEPTQNIAEARYSIDNPSWITDTVTYPMVASDGSFNSKTESIQATIDTTGLTAGRHSIFVEFKDANNNWGVPSATFLYVVEPGVSPVIQGYVREAGTNLPLAANITAGLFTTSTDPATGFYSMTVISGTYNIVAEAADFAPGYANGVIAENYQTIEQDFILYPYCTIFSDDVESGNLGWTAQSPWAITTAASHSPTHSWTDSPGNYGNNLNVSLTSPTFDFSGYSGITLDFWQKYITEANWDYANVQYSTDGNNWNTVASYSGSQSSWTQVNLSIPGLDEQANAQIRYNFTTDSNTVYDGWYVDDIAIIGGGPGCVSDMPPTADFSSDSPVVLGQPVNFTNLTAGTPPISYIWNFGDGSGTSTEDNPAYTYSSSGTYTVSLYAENLFGTDTVTHTVTIEPVVISADFSSDSPVELGEPVHFTNLSGGNVPLSYLWDFGDGSGTSTEENPVYTYEMVGTYTVTLDAYNADNHDTVSHPVSVVPVVITSVDLSQLTPGPIFPGTIVELSADLVPDNAGKPYNYTIDFGDGTILSDVTSLDPQLFTHAYSSSGVFMVQIWVWNAGMIEPVTDTQVVLVSYNIFLPLTTK